MRLTLLGTSDTRRIPVYGCDCPACRAAVQNPALRRDNAMALLSCDEQHWLIDAGLPDLPARFPPHALTGILQTHYHADHAQGLLTLRWGTGLSIPVLGPDDPEGLADLYKHPGILMFAQPWRAFEKRSFGTFTVTALPLRHSRPTVGYLFENAASHRLAYLTDTEGLPDDTLAFLCHAPPDILVLDCNYPPDASQHRHNHNDLYRALALIAAIAPAEAVLTHIGH